MYDHTGSTQQRERHSKRYTLSRRQHSLFLQFYVFERILAKRTDALSQLNLCFLVDDFWKRWLHQSEWARTQFLLTMYTSLKLHGHVCWFTFPTSHKQRSLPFVQLEHLSVYTFTRKNTKSQQSKQCFLYSTTWNIFIPDWFTHNSICY